MYLVVVYSIVCFIVQPVELGNEFKAFSVHDRRVYEYLVDSMFAGRRVSIEFVRIVPGSGIISDVRGRWTHFRIAKVTRAD